MAPEDLLVYTLPASLKHEYTIQYAQELCSLRQPHICYNCGLEFCQFDELGRWSCRGHPGELNSSDFSWSCCGVYHPLHRTTCFSTKEPTRPSAISGCVPSDHHVKRGQPFHRNSHMVLPLALYLLLDNTNRPANSVALQRRGPDLTVLGPYGGGGGSEVNSRGAGTLSYLHRQISAPDTLMCATQDERTKEIHYSVPPAWLGYTNWMLGDDTPVPSPPGGTRVSSVCQNTSLVLRDTLEHTLVRVQKVKPLETQILRHY